MGDQGKLLLISDLEGCVSTFKEKVGDKFIDKPQSQVLCGEDFFTALKTFLSDNPENKVAFLGDYFDQGLMVVDSINRIMDLYEKYQDNVIIILGNRDINKLRFIYEMDENPRESNSLKWKLWEKFYNELPTKTNLYDRIMLILNASMGAPEKIPQIDKKLSKEDATYVLVRAFSKHAAKILNGGSLNEVLDKNYSTFFENVRKLFMVGKIVSYDNDYKVLLSHAGGAEPFLLHNSD
jgi:hypothetical protein